MDEQQVYKSKYTAEQIDEAIGNALEGGGGSQLYRHEIEINYTMPNDESSKMYILCIVITSSETPFDLTTFSNYALDKKTPATGYWLQEGEYKIIYLLAKQYNPSVGEYVMYAQFMVTAGAIRIYPTSTLTDTVTPL